MKNPPRSYTVKVPTKTYLRKFIYAKYGQPLRLNYQSQLGTFLLSLIEKEYFDINMNTVKTEIRLSYMSDEVVFTSSLNTMKYKGHSVNPDKIIAINRYFEDDFAAELFQFCKDNKKERLWRPGITDAIQAFCEMCNIEIDVDITMDALKKAEWRHRKKQEKKFQTFVPQAGKPMQMGFWPNMACLTA